MLRHSTSELLLHRATSGTTSAPNLPPLLFKLLFHLSLSQASTVLQQDLKKSSPLRNILRSSMVISPVQSTHTPFVRHPRIKFENHLWQMHFLHWTRTPEHGLKVRRLGICLHCPACLVGGSSTWYRGEATLMLSTQQPRAFVFVCIWSMGAFGGVTYELWSDILPACKTVKCSNGD
eukprot:1159781-Pelagomonas_calceolata.AAC.4